jgi:hypothetical protein
MLCERCGDRQARDTYTGDTKRLLCLICDLQLENAALRERMALMREDPGDARAEMRELVELAIVRLANASGTFSNELHRDAEMLRRKLAEIEGTT